MNTTFDSRSNTRPKKDGRRVMNEGSDRNTKKGYCEGSCRSEYFETRFNDYSLFSSD